jgi:hypothetical protein
MFHRVYKDYDLLFTIYPVVVSGLSNENARINQNRCVYLYDKLAIDERQIVYWYCQHE